MVLTLTIILTVIVSFLTLCFIKYYKYVKHLEKFPSPPKLPLIGHALDLKSPTDVIPTFKKFSELCGSIVKLYIGVLPTFLLITDYKFVEYILTSNKILDKGPEYRFFREWLGNGLLLADGGSRWRKHRKIIGPSFHIQIFEQFLEVFVSNSQTLAKKLKNELGKSSFDIVPFIKMCSLDIICEATMGTSIHAQENFDSEYVQSVHFMCELFIKRNFNPILRNNFLYKFSKLYRNETRALKILHNYTSEVIEKRKRFLNKEAGQNTIVPSEMKRKMALLDLLLRESEANHTLSDYEIREEVDTFMFAGHDTTASILNFAIFCLAENPAAQDKVVDELKEIYGDDKTRPVTVTDIRQMKYLEAVIKETLRLYPAVPYVSRSVREDFEYGGRIIPKGISLILNIYGLHHDPDLFIEPERFLPERFIDGNLSNETPYSYLPFSAGPRNCIGQKFAMLEMKSLLSILLRQYEFLPSIPAHKLQLSTEIVILSKNGIKVRIMERKF